MISSGLLQCRFMNAVCKISSAFIMLLLIWAVPCSAVPQKLGANAGANNHPHNLSSLSSSAMHALPTETDQICIFCHTPHSASSDGPLWNRADPLGPSGDGSFPLYGSLSGRDTEISIDDTPDAEYGGAFEYPNGTSRLCLSCHDGVTAIGEVINGGWSGPGIAPSIGTMSGSGTIDLDVSHPISFVYNDTVRNFIEANQVGAAGQYTIPAFDSGYLEKGIDGKYRVQCTSCHDPHLDTAFSGYTLPMWRGYTSDGNENLDYEATCTECHVGGSSSGGLDRNPGVPPGGGTGVHPIP